jgi:hypothetical protein
MEFMKMENYHHKVKAQKVLGSASKNGGSSKVGRPLLLRTNYGMSALRSS